MKEKNKSAIYSFGDRDTVYIPKEMTLREAIEWYNKEYEEIDILNIEEVDYSKGFWDIDIPKERLEKIGDWYNGDQWGLDKNEKVQEGTIEAIQGDLYIFKTFATALKENDELGSDIFILCSECF